MAPKKSDLRPSVGGEFAKYVSLNVLSMIGVCAYVLADTLFISMAEGANGVAALSLVLPLYNLIYAIGTMIAAGAATRFKIDRARGNLAADSYFFNAVFFSIFFSLFFVASGLIIPEKLVTMLGGEAEVLTLGTEYTRVFMAFAPFFMLNSVITAFVRNDDAPTLSMAATLSSNLFNIVMDYVLMFVCGLGMFGAALATSFAPVVSILICLPHFFSKKNTLRLRLERPSLRRLVVSCQLGFSSFVNEIATGVSIFVFNLLILEITGNVGVAAFGIVVNLAFVAQGIFSGISAGSQPLLSDAYGRRDRVTLDKLLSLSVITSLVSAVVLLALTLLYPNEIINVFNSEGNPELAVIAAEGLPIYFAGYLFAGLNYVGTGYLSSTAKAKLAFSTSILRGLVAIVACAYILAKLFGMLGIWLAFPAAELITAVVMIAALRKGRAAEQAEFSAHKTAETD